MKRTVLLLLACILLAGTVSAVAVSTGSAGASRVVVTDAHINASVYRVPVTVTETGRGILEVSSVPSGAAVSLDGNTNPGDLTPIKYSLPAGSHTVVLSLAGYQDYTETFSLDNGAIRDISAALKPKISAIPGRVAAVAVTTVMIPPGTIVTPAPDASGKATPVPAGKPGTAGTVGHVPVAVAIVTTTPVPVSCPNPDWSCLTGDEAAAQFGYPNARYGDDPCGYTVADDQTVAKYCFMDAGPDGSLPQSVLSAGTVKEGDDIYILNQTWVQHGVVTRSSGSGTPGQASPFQSIFSFFNGFLGGSVQPQSRLTIVAFAPQPEPPKIATGADNAPGSALNLVSLNPQPEPPAQAPLAGTAG